jgi:hypothetical protein
MDESSIKALSVPSRESRAASDPPTSGDIRSPGARRRSLHQGDRRYGPAERLAFLDECFEKVHALLPSVTTPQELLRLALAVSILIDKRRLEEGKATDCIEVRMSGPRDRLARIMARLASRSRKVDTTSQSH